MWVLGIQPSSSGKAASVPAISSALVWGFDIHPTKRLGQTAHVCKLGKVRRASPFADTHSPSPCSSVYWKAWTRRRASSTERPTGRSLTVI